MFQYKQTISAREEEAEGYSNQSKGPALTSIQESEDDEQYLSVGEHEKSDHLQVDNSNQYLYINRIESSAKDEAVTENSMNYDTLDRNLLGGDQYRVRSLTNKATDQRDCKSRMQYGQFNKRIRSQTPRDLNSQSVETLDRSKIYRQYGDTSRQQRPQQTVSRLICTSRTSLKDRRAGLSSRGLSPRLDVISRSKSAQVGARSSRGFNFVQSQANEGIGSKERIPFFYCGANYDRYMIKLAQRQEQASRQQELKQAIIQKQYSDVIVGDYYNMQIRGGYQPESLGTQDYQDEPRRQRSTYVLKNGKLIEIGGGLGTSMKNRQAILLMENSQIEERRPKILVDTFYNSSQDADHQQYQSRTSMKETPQKTHQIENDDDQTSKEQSPSNNATPNARQNSPLRQLLIGNKKQQDIKLFSNSAVQLKNLNVAMLETPKDTPNSKMPVTTTQQITNSTKQQEDDKKVLSFEHFVEELEPQAFEALLEQPSLSNTIEVQDVDYETTEPVVDQDQHLLLVNNKHQNSPYFGQEGSKISVASRQTLQSAKFCQNVEQLQKWHLKNQSLQEGSTLGQEEINEGSHHGKEKDDDVNGGKEFLVTEVAYVSTNIEETANQGTQQTNEGQVEYAGWVNYYLNGWFSSPDVQADQKLESKEENITTEVIQDFNGPPEIIDEVEEQKVQVLPLSVSSDECLSEDMEEVSNSLAVSNQEQYIMLSQRNLYRKHIIGTVDSMGQHKSSRSQTEQAISNLKQFRKLDEITSVHQSSEYQEVEVQNVNSSSDFSLKNNRLLNVQLRLQKNEKVLSTSSNAEQKQKMFSRSSQIHNKQDSNRQIKVVLEETDGDGVEYENEIGDNDYSADSQAQVEEDDKNNLFKQSHARAKALHETTDIDASDFSADMTVPSEIPQDEEKSSTQDQWSSQQENCYGNSVDQAYDVDESVGQEDIGFLEEKYLQQTDFTQLEMSSLEQSKVGVQQQHQQMLNMTGMTAGFEDSEPEVASELNTNLLDEQPEKSKIETCTATGTILEQVAEIYSEDLADSDIEEVVVKEANEQGIILNRKTLNAQISIKRLQNKPSQSTFTYVSSHQNVPSELAFTSIVGSKESFKNQQEVTNSNKIGSNLDHIMSEKYLNRGRQDLQSAQSAQSQNLLTARQAQIRGRYLKSCDFDQIDESKQEFIESSTKKQYKQAFIERSNQFGMAFYDANVAHDSSYRSANELSSVQDSQQNLEFALPQTGKALPSWQSPLTGKNFVCKEDDGLFIRTLTSRQRMEIFEGSSNEDNEIRIVAEDNLERSFMEEINSFVQEEGLLKITSKKKQKFLQSQNKISIATPSVPLQDEKDAYKNETIEVEDCSDLDENKLQPVTQYASARDLNLRLNQLNQPDQIRNAQSFQFKMIHKSDKFQDSQNRIFTPQNKNEGSQTIKIKTINVSSYTKQTKTLNRGNTTVRIVSKDRSTANFDSEYADQPILLKSNDFCSSITSNLAKPEQICEIQYYASSIHSDDEQEEDDQILRVSHIEEEKNQHMQDVEQIQQDSPKSQSLRKKQNLNDQIVSKRSSLSLRQKVLQRQSKNFFTGEQLEEIKKSNSAVRAQQQSKAFRYRGDAQAIVFEHSESNDEHLQEDTTPFEVSDQRTSEGRMNARPRPLPSDNFTVDQVEMKQEFFESTQAVLNDMKKVLAIKQRTQQTSLNHEISLADTSQTQFRPTGAQSKQHDKTNRTIDASGTNLLTIKNLNGQIILKQDFLTGDTKMNETTIDFQRLLNLSQNDDRQRNGQIICSTMKNSFDGQRVNTIEEASLTAVGQETSINASKNMMTECSQEEQEVLSKLYTSIQRTFTVMQKMKLTNKQQQEQTQANNDEQVY